MQLLGSAGREMDSVSQQILKTWELKAAQGGTERRDIYLGVTFHLHYIRLALISMPLCTEFRQPGVFAGRNLPVRVFQRIPCASKSELLWAVAVAGISCQQSKHMWQ